MEKRRREHTHCVQNKQSSWPAWGLHSHTNSREFKFSSSMGNFVQEKHSTFVFDLKVEFPLIKWSILLGIRHWRIICEIPSSISMLYVQVNSSPRCTLITRVLTMSIELCTDTCIYLPMNIHTYMPMNHTQVQNIYMMLIIWYVLFNICYLKTTHWGLNR